MTLSPRQIHALDQLGGLVREVGRLIAAYRKELAAGGMPDAEAWALAQRLEERLLDPAFDTTKEELKAGPSCPECCSTRVFDLTELHGAPPYLCATCLQFFLA